MAALTVMLSPAWIARASLLEAAANAWPVNDALQKADAIVVLGGSPDSHPFAAAGLFKRGLACRILVADSRNTSAANQPRHVDETRELLGKLDVPRETIAAYGKEVSNTYEEVRALKDWVGAAGAKRVSVPTEISATRRTWWIVARQFAALAAQVGVHAITLRDYSSSGWWQREQGVSSFRTEILKFLYYRFRYGSD